MSRLFADNTDEEVKSYQGCFALVTGLIFFILIPIAGFFWFVWEPLGKGLAFVAVFTLFWSSILTWFASESLVSREDIRAKKIVDDATKILEIKR